MTAPTVITQIEHATGNGRALVLVTMPRSAAAEPGTSRFEIGGLAVGPSGARAMSDQRRETPARNHRCYGRIDIALVLQLSR
jgi:hypothetical protein